MYTTVQSYGTSFKRLKAIQIMGIPYGAALPTITADHEPGSHFYLTTTEELYLFNGTIWKVISGAATNLSSYVISGTGVWSGTGLIMDISDTVYKILGVSYAGTAGQLTHDPADATFPRIDTIYLDDAGNKGILTGVPAAAAVKPQVDPATQVELRTVLIPAGATTPGGISDQTFYNNGTEATNASDIAGIDFFYPTNPISGAESTYAPTFSPAKYISFRKASLYNATDSAFIVFNLRLSVAWTTSQFLSLFLYNNTVATTNAFNIISGANGFTRTVVGTWQTITIPISALALLADPFDKIYFRTNGTSASPFQIDNVRIQTGSYTGGTGVSSFNGRTGAVMPLAGDYYVRSANFASFPATGSTAKIYVAADTGAIYDWNGAAYTVLSAGSATYYLGLYASLVALQTAHPTAASGEYAQVDAGVASDVLFYIWDASDTAWKEVGSGGVVPTAATDAELNTGSNNTKFATALALEGSKYQNQNSSKTNAAATGTDTYAATLTPAITAYASGQEFTIRFANANTGPATININGLGAKDIRKGVSTALVAGDILAGRAIRLHYDGTNFQIVGDKSIDATETVKGIAEIATQAETNAGTDDSRFITPLKLLMFAHAFTALVDGATITWNVAVSGLDTFVILGGDRTLAITNATSGMYGTIIVKQDVTGGRLLTLPAGSKVISGGAGAIVLTVTGGATDILTWAYDGTNFFFNHGKNYS